jgi:hypothetical protein
MSLKRSLVCERNTKCISYRIMLFLLLYQASNLKEEELNHEKNIHP